MLVPVMSIVDMRMGVFQRRVSMSVRVVFGEMQQNACSHAKPRQD